MLNQIDRVSSKGTSFKGRFVKEPQEQQTAEDFFNSMGIEWVDL